MSYLLSRYIAGRARLGAYRATPPSCPDHRCFATPALANTPLAEFSALRDAVAYQPRKGARGKASKAADLDVNTLEGRLRLRALEIVPLLRLPLPPVPNPSAADFVAQASGGESPMRVGGGGGSLHFLRAFLAADAGFGPPVH